MVIVKGAGGTQASLYIDGVKQDKNYKEDFYTGYNSSEITAFYNIKYLRQILDAMN